MSGTRFHRRVRGNFLERTIAGLHDAIERAMLADRVAGGGGLLQPIDPRVKLTGLLVLILAAALSTRLWVVGAIFCLALALALLSALSISTVMVPVWLSALSFTGIMALPAIFVTPGNPVIYLDFPGWSITAQGLTTAAFLILRAETSVTLAMLLVFTTPWTHILKALRTFRVPVVFVVSLGMTFRYILLLLETAREMFESRKSRTVGKWSGAAHRHQTISTVAVLLGKCFQLSNEVYLAMQARGFRGEVYILDEFRMSGRDWAAATAFVLLDAAAIWAGQ